MGSFWQKHKSRQALLRGPQFGTVAGHQTVSELEDLLKIQDFRMQSLKALYDAHAGDVMAVDPGWIIDWVNLSNRYDRAKLKAQIAIQTAPPIGRALVPVQSEFDGVMRAVQQVDMTTSKGDWSDLRNRLQNAGFKMDETNTPQPKAPDADLTVYNKLPKIEVPKVPKVSENTMLAAVGGALLLVLTAIAIRK